MFCPFCGQKIIFENARFCPTCGKELYSHQTDSLRTENVLSEDTIPKEEIKVLVNKKNTKKNFIRNIIIWPDVSSYGGAMSARLYGVWSGGFLSTASVLVGIISLSSGHQIAGTDALVFLIVGILMSALTYGIYKKNLLSSVLALIIFTSDKMYNVYSFFSNPSSFHRPYENGIVIMWVVLFMMFLSAVRGNFALRRFSQEKL